MNATATVNQWNGNGVPYPDCMCWSCGRAKTIAQIPDLAGALLVRLCSECLHHAITAICQAIIESKHPTPPHPPDRTTEECARSMRANSDDDGYPD